MSISLSNLSAVCLSQFWLISHSLQKKGLSHLLENTLFLFFPPKLNGQPAFKFDKNLDVYRIYCMILRMPGFLWWAHLNLIVTFMDPFDIQMHVSRYHAIYTKHVHILVKFERRFFISVLRIKSFFTKEEGWAIPLEIVLCLFFLPNWMDNLPSKFSIKKVWFLSIAWYQACWVFWVGYGFSRGNSLISRFFGALCRTNGRIQPTTSSLLISFDRYSLHLVSCEIWR
jgi:hypothetical protein